MSILVGAIPVWGWLLVKVLLLCALAVLGQAEPPSAAVSREEVARLVGELDARQLGQRDRAERKLIELGPAVLPLLPALDQRTPAETATRIGRVQQHLLRTQAMASSGTSTFTFKAAGAPLSEVLENLGKQSGNRIADHRATFGQRQDDPPVTADFQKTPFWRALDDVLDQAGLTLYGFSGERGAFVVGRPPGVAPRARRACYAGAFRLEPLRFEAVRDLRNDSMQSLKLFVEVSWEPRLQPFAILQPLGRVVATTDTGDAVEVVASEAEPEALVRDGVSTVELEIPFALPARKATKIASLRGKILALVPGVREEFRFPGLNVSAKNAAAGGSQQKAGTTVTVDHVRKNSDAWEVALRLKFEAPPTALESHRSWILDNEAYFEIPGRQRVEAGGIEQTREGRDEIGLNYFFDLDDVPRQLTFVYRTPIMILELPLEYEFRDLPLP